MRFQKVIGEPTYKRKEWYAHLSSIPEDAIFVCAYVVFMNPADFGVSAFFRRTNGFDELWVASWDAEFNVNYKDIEHGQRKQYDSFSCALAIPSTIDVKAACQTLLYYELKADLGYSSPGEFVRSGLLTDKEYFDVILSIKDEIADNLRQAEKNKSEIITVAQELGLQPEPTGKGLYSWRASCPNTRHPIWIDTQKDIFGCPWCKKKGDSELLRLFVKERKVDF